MYIVIVMSKYAKEKERKKFILYSLAQLYIFWSENPSIFLTTIVGPQELCLWVCFSFVYVFMLNTHCHH